MWPTIRIKFICHKSKTDLQKFFIVIFLKKRLGILIEILHIYLQFQFTLCA